MSTRQPTVFIPHGAGPCFFMEWQPAQAWDRMAAFLRDYASTLPARPSAIVCVSAHWLAPHIAISSQATPRLYFDYYGFPQHTYELEYPAAGSPEIAQRIADLLAARQIPHTLDAARDFDHGMFIPLKLMFPLADIPVVQVSLHHSLDPAVHLALGQSLAPLRDENILIVGSGMSFHNMRGYGDPRFGPISDEFDAWLADTVQAPAGDCRARLGHWSNAPQARLCHPAQAEEHLLPLMVVAGAAGDDRGRKIFSDRVLETTLSAFEFIA